MPRSLIHPEHHKKGKKVLPYKRRRPQRKPHPSLLSKSKHPPHLEEEILRRAILLASQRVLQVDYYRIQRKYAWKLPLTSLGELPNDPVPGLPNYPWATWLTWTLEERIFTLGWAAEWTGEKNWILLAQRDLQALASFPRYFSDPHHCTLDASWCGRILATALLDWTWLSPALTQAIRAALNRFLREANTYLTSILGQLSDPVTRPAQTAKLMSNIPLIGFLSCALVATMVDHPKKDELNNRAQELLTELARQHGNGLSEGVCYDGFILDVVSTWLRALPDREGANLIPPLRLNDLFTRTLAFGLPADPSNLAPIGDVEPQMTFHISAQAKLESLLPCPSRRAWLQAIPLSKMRTEALAFLPHASDASDQSFSTQGIYDGGYGISLRNSPKKLGLTPVLSVHNSASGHLHKDAGHLCLGSQHEWLITDPGYQQYQPGAEREFTLGPTAHNAPVIDGHGQSRILASRCFQTITETHFQGIGIDLTSAYADLPSISSVHRYVWLTPDGIVAIADKFIATAEIGVEYFWHGAPEAFWEKGQNCFSIHGLRSSLTLQAAGISLNKATVTKLNGSPGHLTLEARTPILSGLVWWIFSHDHDALPTLRQASPTSLILNQKVLLTPDAFDLSKINASQHSTQNLQATSATSLPLPRGGPFAKESEVEQSRSNTLL
jgi:Heparinase II/III-like protein